jgi:hypothetical protein
MNPKSNGAKQPNNQAKSFMARGSSQGFQDLSQG